jgi:hypothetical protein
VAAWGLDFLTRGYAHARVSSPLYDGEQFQVDIIEQEAKQYRANLVRPNGTISAEAEAGLLDTPPAPPQRRGDPIAAADYSAPAASHDSFSELRETGCKAFRYHWGPEHLMRTYLRDVAQIPALLTGAEAYANMSFILGISNFIAADNIHMNPWVHLETRSQNYRPVANGTSIIAEMSVTDLFEKKGHQFFDAEVVLYDEANDNCLSSIELRAIYKLRGA